MQISHELAPTPIVELESRRLERVEYAEILGRSAVNAAELTTSSTLTESPGAELEVNTLNQELEEARRDITIASPAEKKKFGNYLISDGVPTWLIGAVDESNPTRFVDKLCEKSEDGTYAVPNETFLNVLQWHSMNMREKDQALEQGVFSKMRQRYISRLEGAMKRGWPAADVIDSAKLRLVQETPVHVYDGIGSDKSFRGVTGMATAHANPKALYIVYRNTNGSAKKLESIFTHEMTHVITGSTDKGKKPVHPRLWEGGSDQVRSTEEKPVSGGYGIHRLHDQTDMDKESQSTRLFSKESQGLSLLNEAITEHFAQALLGKDVEKVRVMGLNGTYRNGMRLLKMYCEGGRERISPTLFINAMLEGQTMSDTERDSPPSVHLHRLREALSRSFPNGDPITPVANMDSHGLLGGVTVKEMSGALKQLHQLAA